MLIITIPMIILGVLSCLGDKCKNKKIPVFQPFYSRGSLPYISILIVILFYIIYLGYFIFTYEQLQYFDCVATILLTNPLYIGLFLIFPLNSINWTFILNINKRKSYFVKIKTKNKKTGIFFF